MLLGDNIYANKYDDLTIEVSRGLSLHKMLRLLTFSLGGEGYMNFIGNEFGHPDWIDLPSDSNGHSCDHAMRKWHLKFDPNMRFHQLAEFDRVMNFWEKIFGSMTNWHRKISSDEKNQVIIYEKGELLYIFNFSQTNFDNYLVGTPWWSDHMILFDTDEGQYGGYARLHKTRQKWLKTKEGYHHDHNHCIDIPLPSRCAVVLVAQEHAQKPGIVFPQIELEKEDVATVLECKKSDCLI